MKFSKSGANAKFSIGIALTAVLLASSAEAAITSPFTQTVSIPSASTDVTNAAALFNKYGSIGAPAGDVLTSVTLEIQISESLNTLTLTNTTSSPQTATYIASANFDSGDTASATDGTALDNALPNHIPDPAAAIYDTGSLSFTASQVYTSASFPLPKVLTESTGVLSAASLTPYQGTGTFDLEYSTLSGFTVAGGGNNIDSTQGTTTSATATVVYTFGPATPEPASLSLLGTGLAALGLRRRRNS